MGDALRSVPPHQYTHIFVAGLVFAAADAFATGANDIGACLPLCLPRCCDAAAAACSASAGGGADAACAAQRTRLPRRARRARSPSGAPGASPSSPSSPAPCCWAATWPEPSRVRCAGPWGRAQRHARSLRSFFAVRFPPPAPREQDAVVAPATRLGGAMCASFGAHGSAVVPRLTHVFFCRALLALKATSSTCSSSMAKLTRLCACAASAARRRASLRRRRTFRNMHAGWG